MLANGVWLDVVMGIMCGWTEARMTPPRPPWKHWDGETWGWRGRWWCQNREPVLPPALLRGSGPSRNPGFLALVPPSVSAALPPLSQAQPQCFPALPSGKPHR